MSRKFIQTLLRIAVLVAGLVLLVAGGYVVLHAFGALPGLALGPSVPAVGGRVPTALSLTFGLEGISPRTRLFWVLGGLGGVLLGLFLLWLATKRSTESRMRRVVLSDAGEENTYGGGRVTVTEESLQALVAYVAGRVGGVREAHPTLALRNGGWRCRCPVTVLPSASLPAVTKELKAKLQETLEHHTGLPVEGVDVDAQLNAQNARRRLR